MADSGLESTEDIKRSSSFFSKNSKRTKSLCNFRFPFIGKSFKTNSVIRKKGSRRDKKSVYLHSLEENNISSFDSVDFETNLEKSTIHFSTLTLNDEGRLQGNNVRPGKKGSVKVMLRDANKRFGNKSGMC